ncbi:long-chain-fatty-acid--CoA ligase [Flammeovirga pectinis]|uniref:Long-chain-fatty-acid--CoA ligase n=1 Tax=Flammeovirga pectinis TaxID=2494373 RepID=A0A3S9NZI2_9BACT|nr:AMP-binding protein [Flammeovirga pectinis]AZQ61330.1 long-chain-fatty-acid--CoA ligase [Flammeovirga pectinis]
MEQKRPWYKHYADFTPQEINPDNYQSLIALFEESFKKFSDKVAYECMGAKLTYKEVDLASERFAAYLQNSCGMDRGDRIAIQMPNVLQYPIAMIGAIRAGMVVVNTNPLYTEREMLHQFTDAGVKTVVIMANFADKLQNCLPKAPSIKNIIITEIGDLLAFPKSLIVNSVVKYVKKMVPAFSIPNAVKFKTALRKGATSTYVRPILTGEDHAFLQYTGGTTGVAKGAILTHRNIVANLEQSNAWLQGFLKEGEELVVTALPLYHIFALTVNCMTMMKIGAHNLLITNPRDMDAFIGEISKYKFSIMTGVNTLFNGMLNHNKFADLDFSKLKVTIGGGMAVQQAVAKRWEEITKCTLAEGYGLTETSPVVCVHRLDNPKIGTIGLPYPSTDVKVLDEDGKEVAIGETGELCVNGPQVMKGYWNRPQETEDTFFPNGWLRTGDIATMDHHGYFKIVDRIKDMVLVSGFNVYPNEVEEVLVMHEGVDECAVIGVPDEKSTEAVKCFIVKKDQHLTQEQLKSFCKQNLAGYKVPRHYEFRTELPKSAVGKILRRVLKEEELAKTKKALH